LGRSKKTGEHELIQTLERLLRAKKSKTRGVVVGVGDDTAVVRPRSGEDLLMTTDALIEGQHFRREWFSGVELGWRLAAVNLSDIAAMGGRPLYGLLSLGIPDDVGTDYIKDIERGVRDHLAKYGASIIGGNISGIDGALVCDFTLVGAVPTGKAWRRRCKPGRDAIVVIGNIGEARAGLHMVGIDKPQRPFQRLVRAYKRPKPLLEVVELLRREKGIHGMIDVSDGLSTDLIHICRASNAGCEVDLEQVPLSKTLQEFCIEHGKVALQLALHGGEDYALIVSVDAKRADAVVSTIRDKTGIPATRVGRFTGSKGVYTLIASRGRRMPLMPKGWDHLKMRG
jgi:thiamine-monophosphate kinase